MTPRLAPIATLLLAAAGCAGTGGAAAARPEFTVVSSRSPGPDVVLEAAAVEPARPGTERWQRTDRDAGFEVRTSVEGAAMTRTDPRGTRLIERTADGALALREQRDAADGSATAFGPPLTLAPATLRAGEEPAFAARITAVRAGLASDDGGSARRTVRIASVDRVRTPLGEFDAVRVDAVLDMKLPFASMRRETSTWVRPGDGPVAVRSDERILVMGIVPRNTAETRVRLPGGGGAP